MNIPRIGVGIILENKHNQVLLGLRSTTHGNGTWAPPGGHLEFGETIVACAQRELDEETGLILVSPAICDMTEDIFEKTSKHYVTIFVKGTFKGILVNKEPDKCIEWKWFAWKALPSPLFLPFEQFIEHKVTWT